MSIDTLRENLKLPAIAAPMFLVSGPDLVVECCRSGIIGTFPALNQRSSTQFESWLIEISDRLQRATEQGERPAVYGVNLIVHKTNPRLAADLEICVKHKVPLIITSLGAVPDVVSAVHSYGGCVFHDVIKLRHAEKAAEAGVDGLIAVCAGAGGHSGMLNPFAFIGEIRRFFNGVVALSGSLSSGADIAAARALGADFAYMGTRFINTRESLADSDYQEMIVGAAASDIEYTDQVSGIHANFLRSSLLANGYSVDEDAHGSIEFASEREARAWKDIWSAGHGVGVIDDIPAVSTLVATLRTEFNDARGRLAADQIFFSD